VGRGVQGKLERGKQTNKKTTQKEFLSFEFFFSITLNHSSSNHGYLVVIVTYFSGLLQLLYYLFIDFYCIFYFVIFIIIIFDSTSFLGQDVRKYWQNSKWSQFKLIWLN